MIFCAAVMTAVIVPMRNALWDAGSGLMIKIAVIAVLVIVGMAVYIIMSRIIRLYEAQAAFDFVKNILGRKRNGTEE